jgi:hypothetical protein
LFIVSCSPKIGADQTTVSNTDELAYRNKAYEVLDVVPVTFEENATGEYVLAAYLKEEIVPGVAPLKIVVINTNNNEVVLKKVLNNGLAKWKSDFILEIVAPPGMPNGNQTTLKDYTTLYDVRTGKKVKPLNVKITD